MHQEAQRPQKRWIGVGRCEGGGGRGAEVGWRWVAGGGRGEVAAARKQGGGRGAEASWRWVADGGRGGEAWRRWPGGGEVGWRRVASEG
ncbi:hypothetical protein GUJ93_ZPchr0012g20217 [Zizania palustris]|uniref:Uncharacterized protein n=1 Tax=Zizania palustris TaxID=103762 RepID=A0A8J6BVY4_ZIZPA|nr:hypothetical protein GUJ93_ZPchr0012g20217 [Zizania palustris]